MRTKFDRAVFKKVMQAVEQTVHIERGRLTPESRLADDLRLRRFGRIRLALYLEEMFGVEVSNEEIERFDTVGDIVRYMSHWSL
jgi:acyl carrier protein